MRHSGRTGNVRFAAFIILVAGCFLLGGASRGDVPSLILLQPIAAICAAVFVLMPGPIDWRPVRIPLLLVAALAGIMATQLIPLPPLLWENLPGHAPFAQTAIAAQVPQPWRPISLTPDLTLSSLVGLVVPVAALIGFASLHAHHRRRLLSVILAGVAVSALFGLAQISGGRESPFYTFKITNLGNAVGLFSNRNHHAVLLAMTWPMLAAWVMRGQVNPHRRLAESWIAAGSAVFLLPLLLVTGSRAGLLLGMLALVGAGFIWRTQGADGRVPARLGRLFAPAIGLVALIILGTTIVLSRAEAIQRLLNIKADQDLRFEATPILLRMTRDFFPVGSGFGSFDPVFRYYEPLELLRPEYLNHAHDDLLEFLITGGLPSAALGLLFLVWFARGALRVWRTRRGGAHTQLGRVASLMIALVLAASLVDYPLRTPLMMLIFAIACGWLGASNRQPTHDGVPE